MNKEKILEVAAAIRKGDERLGFNMIDFYTLAGWSKPDMSGNQCGTVACIAGWAVFLEDGPEALALGRNIERRAAKILGLPEDHADRLFSPDHTDRWSSITPDHAASVLEEFAETGKIEWWKNENS